MVKLDVDTLATVPDAPPLAGPDRALDAPPPDPVTLATPVAGPGCAAVVEEVVTRPTESPITAAIAAAATTIHRLLLFPSTRHGLGRQTWLAVGTEADGGAAVGAGGLALAPLELPADGGAAGGVGGFASELPAAGGSEVGVDAG